MIRFTLAFQGHIHQATASSLHQSPCKARALRGRSTHSHPTVLPCAQVWPLEPASLGLASSGHQSRSCPLLQLDPLHARLASLTTWKQRREILERRALPQQMRREAGVARPGQGALP